jgi:hypothetical protein
VHTWIAPADPSLIHQVPPQFRRQLILATNGGAWPKLPNYCISKLRFPEDFLEYIWHFRAQSLFS